MYKKKNQVKRKDVQLRSMYDSGEITAEEFLEKLFASKEGDRNRINIVRKKERQFNS